MANIVYADPFGAYVHGQQLGQQQAIQAGQAARQFRAEDLDPRVQAWYLPLIRAEQSNQALTSELGNAAKFGSYTGNFDPFNNYLGNFYGQSPSTFQPMTPQQRMIGANIVADQYGPNSAAVTLPGITGIGRYGTYFGGGGPFVSPMDAARETGGLGQGGVYGIPRYPGETDAEFYERTAAMRKHEMSQYNGGAGSVPPNPLFGLGNKQPPSVSAPKPIQTPPLSSNDVNATKDIFMPRPTPVGQMPGQVPQGQ